MSIHDVPIRPELHELGDDIRVEQKAGRCRHHLRIRVASRLRARLGWPTTRRRGATELDQRRRLPCAFAHAIDLLGGDDHDGFASCNCQTRGLGAMGGRLL